jgi:hypothetical protein
MGICRGTGKRGSYPLKYHLACSFVSDGVPFRSFTNDSMKGYLCRLKSASELQTVGQLGYAE